LCSLLPAGTQLGFDFGFRISFVYHVIIFASFSFGFLFFLKKKIANTGYVNKVKTVNDWLAMALQRCTYIEVQIIA
jgi:hypothetical protein